MGCLLREDRMGVISQSINVASVSANTTAEQDFTVPGLTTDMVVLARKPSLSAGLAVCGVRVKSADTMAITFGNFTASPIDPAAETYLIFWFKPEAATDKVNL